jgi:ribosome-binding protein aMBF1 (putative translation factor)
MKRTHKPIRRKKTSISRKTTDAIKIIDKMIGRRNKVRELVDEALLNAKVAQMIYDARTASGLTQKQLAGLVGTQQSAIARLEDADYDGHSLSMLERIASALNQRLDVRFISNGRR